MIVSPLIVPELFFLKYKGVPSPWEIVSQAKRLGFKCKKYANWPEVHATENSRQMLKAVGDSLIDSSEFDLSSYPEFSQVWEKVQRWAKDKDGFSLEPDLLPEYEKLSRLIDVGSNAPNVVDLVIEEFGLSLNAIEIDDRWLVFLSICVYNFLLSRKRYEEVLVHIANHEGAKHDSKSFVIVVAELITALYLLAGFDTSQFESSDVIYLFIEELGLLNKPQTIERDGLSRVKSLPKVWVDRFDGTNLELVKFEYSDGDIFVKVNRLNRIFTGDSDLGKLLATDAYWLLVGKSIESQISQIDEIQDFFNIFARHLRTLT